MSCLTSGVWDAFAARQMPEADWDAVRQHLDACDDCRGRFSRAEATAVGGKPAPPRTHEQSVGALERGTTVGRYLVLDAIGHGGMGLVYAAFDPELDRKVAIKLLRADLVSSEERRQLFRARLVREAQAMARLSHPNVIPVYDVGSIGDRLFVAMELVEGGTLKSWLRAEKPGWRAVLALFLQAGRGLAAAHAAGLVHRDFKPDNILVGRDGRPRVTDFGLARAVLSASDLPVLDDDHDSPSHSGSFSDPLTRHGTVMGTPGYMSPEQCLAKPTDTPSDQFSFCAALYEAIYGERPFPGVGPDEVIAAVKRGEIRQPPATSDVPAWVRKPVLRGLAFDPAARWPSMDALLDALSRDPALRRRRWLTAAAAVVLVGAVAGGVRLRAQRDAVCQGAQRKLDGIWDGARRQRVVTAFRNSGLPYAERAWQEVSAALDVYAGAWTGMHTDACEATRVRGEQTDATLELRMTCLEGRRKELKALTDLFANADGDTVGEAVKATAELSPVAMCGDLPMLTAVVPPPTDPRTRDKVDGLRTQLAEARALLQSGKYAAGLSAVRAVLPQAHAVGYRPLEAEALELTGRLQQKSSDYQAAGATLKQAVWMAEEGRVDDVKIAAATRLANVSVDLKGFEAAHDWLQYGQAALRRIGTPRDRQIDLAIAEAIVNFRQGRYLDSEKAARQAVSLAEQTYGTRHLHTAEAWTTLGDTLKYQGRYTDALEALRTARTACEALLGADHPEVAIILRKESDVYGLQHDGARELELARQALAVFERSLEPRHLWIAQVRTNASEALSLLGHYDEAIAEERRAMATYARVFGPASENVGVSLTNIGTAELRLKRLGDARRDLEHAIAIYEKTLSPDNPDRAEPLLRLGQLELADGNASAAVSPLERAQKARAHDGDPCEMLNEIERVLAQAVAKSNPARARKLTEAVAARHCATTK